ncbi:acyl carrier protein [Azospirillum sp. B4]|uniref:acyl carrier protein n=1 Tax=Azospirillum sp. B4 TaxID=95605 RepID=UPI00131F0F81|nr:acyl carrier protein [Azospirillum sp. B4]
MKRAEILAIIEDLAGTPPGSATESQVLMEFGEWDSLAGSEFRVAVAETWGVKLSGVAMEQVQTVGDMLALLRPHLDD